MSGWNRGGEKDQSKSMANKVIAGKYLKPLRLKEIK